MGLVYTDITLKNATDVGSVRRGIMKESDIHQTTVRAMVDTGCFALVIPEAVRQELGLDVIEEYDVTLAYETTSNLRFATCKKTEPVEIYWKNRSTAAQAKVLPTATEVLLGGISLLGMDLIVDPARQTVIGAHGEKAVYPVK
jgi:predicted aspartyl protease